jgi:hypothetical protein
MAEETIVFQPFYEKNSDGKVSEPSAYAVMRRISEPHGLQYPLRFQTMEELFEHITAQLQSELFDFNPLRVALFRRKTYAVSVDSDLASRLVSRPLVIA